MKRTTSISFRVDAALKEAAARAAGDDGRSLAGYIERLLRTHLAERGYLPAGGRAEAPAKPARRPGGRRGR